MKDDLDKLVYFIVKLTHRLPSVTQNRTRYRKIDIVLYPLIHHLEASDSHVKISGILTLLMN